MIIPWIKDVAIKMNDLAGIINDPKTISCDEPIKDTKIKRKGLGNSYAGVV